MSHSHSGNRICCVRNRRMIVPAISLLVFSVSYNESMRVRHLFDEALFPKLLSPIAQTASAVEMTLRGVGQGSVFFWA